ncbi:DUF3679 domain-containing protein [Bacillaceae bacterium S4-13-58]
MTRFIIWMLTLISLFLFGVIFGINQASQGILSIKGYEGGNWTEAVQVKDNVKGETNDESYVVEVMGKTFEQQSLKEKQSIYQTNYEETTTQKIAGTFQKTIQWGYNQLVFIMHEVAGLLF